MLDDRKLSARALFDDSSHRQTQLAVRVHTGQTLCYKLPFHVYVSVFMHNRYTVTQTHASRQTEWDICFCLSQDTADYIRPISFSLRFKINNTESGPVLDEGWPTTVKKYVSESGLLAFLLHHICFLCSPCNMLSFSPFQISFFKDCGEDDVCTTDLVLQAHMDISGTRYRFEILHYPLFFPHYFNNMWVV